MNAPLDIGQVYFLGYLSGQDSSFDLFHIFSTCVLSNNSKSERRGRDVEGRG